MNILPRLFCDDTFVAPVFHPLNAQSFRWGATRRTGSGGSVRLIARTPTGRCSRVLGMARDSTASKLELHAGAGSVRDFPAGLACDDSCDPTGTPHPKGPGHRMSALRQDCCVRTDMGSHYGVWWTTYWSTPLVKDLERRADLVREPARALLIEGFDDGLLGIKLRIGMTDDFRIGVIGGGGQMADQLEAKVAKSVIPWPRPHAALRSRPILGSNGRSQSSMTGETTGISAPPPPRGNL